MKTFLKLFFFICFLKSHLSFHLLQCQAGYNSSSLNKESHNCDSVWISDFNQYRFLQFCDFISLFSPQFQFCLRRYIEHSRQCLTTFPNTSGFIQNTPLQVVFSSTLFSVFGKVVKQCLLCFIYYYSFILIFHFCCNIKAVCVCSEI